MDLARIERSLRASAAGVLVLDARFLRRIIKEHRRLPGLGLEVPHAGCYAIAKSALLPLVDPPGLLGPIEDLPSRVVLVARPSAADLVGRSGAEITRRLFRAAFHADVHRALDERVERGELGLASVRALVDRIGQVEFDEIRAALRQDDRLFSAHDDVATFVEFAALWLELRHFAPALVATTFPALGDPGRIDALLAREVDGKRLLERCFPEGADELATVLRDPPRPAATVAPSTSRLTISTFFAPRPPTLADVGPLLARADEARRRGNLVRSGLLRAAAAAADARARAGLRADMEALGARLNEALRPIGDDGDARATVEWTSPLVSLAEAAAARRGLRYPIEARLLYDLQRAAYAHERPHKAVDVVTWALSRGRLPVVRELPAAREIRVARQVRAASAKVRSCRLPSAERKILARLCAWADDRADANVRAALRPRLDEVLAAVALRPRDVPERVARDKRVEELLDHGASRGFLGLAQLRDAVSRNQLKLEGLGGPRELWAGDALLRADELLARSLDGVYRGGEIYLRGFEKLSSLAFGTRPGRIVTLFAILPLAGAFVLLEGLGHVVSPIAGALGAGPVALVTPLSLGATALVVLALLHSRSARAMGRAALAVLGTLLAVVFLRAPRWLLTRPSIARALRSRPMRVAARRVLVPCAVASAITFLSPLADQAPLVVTLASIGIAIAASAALDARIADAALDLVLDWLAPTVRVLGHRVLPGLLAMVTRAFRALVDLLERAMNRIDEALRFRDGEARWALVAKAALGVVWFAIAYVVRLYVTLFIEPELNPLKHFPVITVSQKLTLPFTPDLLAWTSGALSFLGPVVGGTIAAVTVFFLPSASGFFFWELKENYKLYRASRPETLAPVIVGSHGETIPSLLVPAFHGGTLPRLYSRLRRAAQREDAAAAEAPASGQLGAAPEGALGRFREGAADVERAVRRFVEREFVTLLRRAPRFRHGPVEVSAIELGSNRLRVTLRAPAIDASAAVVTLEEQSGFVVAGLATPGFFAAPPEGSELRVLLENALAGFYQLAGVDLVREQIEAVIGDGARYDVADEGLVVWPGGAYGTEILYPLRTGRGVLEPEVRGASSIAEPPPILDATRLFFSRQAIAWPAWVAAWSGEAPPPRLVRGGSILPRARREARAAG